jgi:hypothetical protein
VHAARLKQHGRRFPLCIFEMLTSTRRWRVSGFRVALTHRTHSQRAIGVMSFHSSWIVSGAAARAARRPWGTFGSGQSSRGTSSSSAVSPARSAAAPLLLCVDPHPVAELTVRFDDSLERVPVHGCLDRHLATGRQLVTRLLR